MLTGHSTEKSSCCVINVNGLAFGNFLEIMRNGFFLKCLVLTDSDSNTQTRERPTELRSKYGGDLIKVQITKETTFEKDVIYANKTGVGKEILLDVLETVRPNSGKIFRTSTGSDDINLEAYFALIEKYKSEFAYNLMLALDQPNVTFAVPDYITEGVTFLIDAKNTNA